MTRALVVLLFAAGVASADDKEKAVELFTEGQKEMKAGNFAKACDAFRESNRLHPDSGTKGSLAKCFEKIGKVASAWKLWTDLSTTAPERLRPDAAENAKKLEPRVPKYIIHSKIPIQATIDGEVVDSTLDLPHAIDPGKYVFEANAEGYGGWRYDLVAVEGKTTVIDVDMAVKAAPKPIETPIEKKPKKSSRKKVGIALAGVGGAFLVGGSVLGVIAKGRYDDAKDICGGDINRCSPLRISDAQDKVDSARTAGNLSTIAFVAGGAAVIAGIVLIVTAPKPSESSIAIAPVVHEDGAGVIVRGGF